MWNTSCKTEREKLRDRVREAGRKWSLMGILGTEGEGVRATRKAILKYLSETGLIGIQCYNSTSGDRMIW